MILRTPHHHPIWTLGYKLASSRHSFWPYLWDNCFLSRSFFSPLWKLTGRYPLLIIDQGWVVLQVIYADELSQPDLACKLYLVWTWGKLLVERCGQSFQKWPRSLGLDFLCGLRLAQEGCLQIVKSTLFFFFFLILLFFYSVPDF